MTSAIDVDDPSSWPHELRAVVDQVAESHDPDAVAASDLWLGDDDDAEITAALADIHVRLYHATRLLPCEVDHVRTDGLRLLDEELINRRITCAVEAGAMNDADAAVLRTSHVLVTDAYGRRRDQVCAGLTTAAFKHDVGAVDRLLTLWGGEAIYWLHADEPFASRLARIGSPAIIVLHSPAGRPGDNYFPSLPQALVGAVLGVPDAGGDVFLRRAVPPDAIETIWSPGTPSYDQFPNLPRT